MIQMWTERHIDALRRLPAIEHDKGGDESLLPPDVLWAFYCAGIVERPADGRFSVTDTGMDLWERIEDLLTDECGLPRAGVAAADIIGWSESVDVVGRPTRDEMVATNGPMVRGLQAARILAPFQLSPIVYQ